MNFHAPVIHRSFSTALSEHYTAVRARLGGVPAARPVEIPAAPALFLPPPAPQVVVDLVPDQRGRDAVNVLPVGTEVEIMAARRALMIFARLRDADPGSNSVRHLQKAIAEAFRVDLFAILGRSRKRGITRMRQIAMAMACRCCRLSRAEIARRFDRDHTTVLWAEKKWMPFLDGATSQIGGGR